MKGPSPRATGAGSPPRSGHALVHDPFGRGWLEFEGERVLVAERLHDVRPTLAAVRRAVDDGRWAFGFLSYEAAPGLDETLAAWPTSENSPPLAWWIVGPPPRQAMAPGVQGALPAGSPLPGPEEQGNPAATELTWRPRLEKEEHRRRVEQIRQLIADGETYQVNFTFGLESQLDGLSEELDPEELFAHLWRAQQAPYSAFVDTGRWAICSASPELFFRQDGDHLTARPMKGTARRGRFSAEDQERLEELHSEKNRAENLMITDMTRNDLGRLARPGSVVVDRLFAAETYDTVHQLISEVRASTEAHPVDVLSTLFPCASITGAPKKRATEIIRDLEQGPRGVYTGAIGWMAPGRRAQFSVAIRTAVIDRERRRAHYGVGGGIVWDSRAEAEYDECRAKALVLARPRPDFDLLETFAWRPRRGFVRLEGHLDRLADSARFFDFRFDRDAILQALDSRAASFDALRHRVRVRLEKSGELHIDTAPWPCSGRETWRLVLDDRPVDERETLLFHKTSHRQLYDEARQRHPDADEVILWNRHGRLTEGTRSNLVLRFGEKFLTPPLADGLLPGVYRSQLLRRGRLQESPLGLTALSKADAIFCINSLRGWIRGEILDLDPPALPNGPAKNALKEKEALT